MLYDQPTRDAARRAADHLTAHPEAHTQHVMARDADGRSVSFDLPGAVCHCAAGRLAYELIGGIEQEYAAMTITKAAIGSTERDRLIALNDTDKADGLAALYRIGEGKAP